MGKKTFSFIYILIYRIDLFQFTLFILVSHLMMKF